MRPRSPSSNRIRLRRKVGVGVGAGALALLASGFASAQTPDPNGYDALPQEPAARWHVWASEGPAGVSSQDQTFHGNRLRLGGELQFGPRHRFFAGLTALDVISSGETSPDVGDLSRSGSDLTVGAFAVPDVLWFAYSLHLQNVHGANITGSAGALGHQLAVGVRVYRNDAFTVSLEGAFLHVNDVTVDALTLGSSTFSSATYPMANAWTVSLRVGFDFYRP